MNNIIIELKEKIVKKKYQNRWGNQLIDVVWNCVDQDRRKSLEKTNPTLYETPSPSQASKYWSISRIGYNRERTYSSSSSSSLSLKYFKGKIWSLTPTSSLSSSAKIHFVPIAPTPITNKNNDSLETTNSNLEPEINNDDIIDTRSADIISQYLQHILTEEEKQIFINYV